MFRSVRESRSCRKRSDLVVANRPNESWNSKCKWIEMDEERYDIVVDNQFRRRSCSKKVDEKGTEKRRRRRRGDSAAYDALSSKNICRKRGRFCSGENAAPRNINIAIISAISRRNEEHAYPPRSPTLSPDNGSRNETKRNATRPISTVWRRKLKAPADAPRRPPMAAALKRRCEAAVQTPKRNRPEGKMESEQGKNNVTLNRAN